jgi:hypothetical protein
VRLFVLPAAALVVGASTLIALAQSPCDRALRIVLTNTAKEGLLAARAEYDTDCITGAELVAASRRVLEAQSGRLFGGPYNAAAAKEHLLVAESVRRSTDISKEVRASIADFDFQIARAIVATTDPKVRPIWQANIKALALLQGNWIEPPRLQSLLDATDDEPQNDEYLRVFGGIFEMRSSDGRMARAFVTLSSGLAPMQINLYGFNEDYVFAAAGIYRLDGDTLQLAFGRGPDNRPKTVQEKSAGDGTPIVVVHTYRRLRGAPPVRQRAEENDKSLLPWLEPTDQ